MKYTITYLIDGQSTKTQIEARDAASAVATIKWAHNSGELFELLSVILVDKSELATREAKAA